MQQNSKLCSLLRESGDVAAPVDVVASSCFTVDVSWVGAPNSSDLSRNPAIQAIQL